MVPPLLGVVDTEKAFSVALGLSRFFSPGRSVLRLPDVDADGVRGAVVC